MKEWILARRNDLLMLAGMLLGTFLITYVVISAHRSGPGVVETGMNRGEFVDAVSRVAFIAAVVSGAACLALGVVVGLNIAGVVGACSSIVRTREKSRRILGKLGGRVQRLKERVETLQHDEWPETREVESDSVDEPTKAEDGPQRNLFGL